MKISSVRPLPVLALSLGALAGCSSGGAPEAFAETPIVAAQAEGFRRAAPGYEWSFPRDHWAHRDYRNEWWYFTGHLRDRADPSREFGFQFTLFRIALQPQPQPFDSEWSTAGLIMGHASIVNKQSGEHRFSEVLYRESEPLGAFLPFEGDATGPIAWVRGPAGTASRWTLAGLDPGFAMSLADREKRFALELDARPTGPVVFQGPGGFSAKQADGRSGSLYYSYPRLSLAGQLRLDGEPFDVEGVGWMDKEFSSNHLSETQVGWDWFSLQLEDGSNAMLFRLRRKDGSQDFASGTWIDPLRSPRYLEESEIELRPGREWRSAETGFRYPVEWQLRWAGGTSALRILAVVDGQENRSRARGGLAYWEGAVEVRNADGRTIGRGYLEMTGYGEDNRPPI